MILHNRVRCKKCNDVIESKSRHDFVECSCGSVFVDGGHDYIRGGWPGGDYKDWVEDLHEIVEDAPPPPKVGLYGLLLDQSDHLKIVRDKPVGKV